MADKQDACIITGAAGGVGCELVSAFVKKGYFVIAIDVVAEPADLEVDAYLQMDLSRFVQDESYASAVVDEIRKLVGIAKLKVLINNAATQVLRKIEAFTREDWADTVNTNVLAPFFLTQSLLSDLESAKGGVINIGSIHASLTKPGFVAYATSKAAIRGLTRSMAVDLGQRLRINAIEPAAIDTNMLRGGFGDRPHALQALAKVHPVGRIGTPSEVARLAVWLAEDAPQFMQGECIRLDGGIGARLHDPS